MYDDKEHGIARIGESSLSITQRPGHLLDAANDDDDDDDDDDEDNEDGDDDDNDDDVDIFAEI